MITQSELKQILHYDQYTGIFTWLKYKQRPSKIGAVAGNITSYKYWTICINNKQYYAHRLAWLYMMGSNPIYALDHIDANKLNNAFTNLRECTPAQNSQNFIKAKITNKIGLLGVSVRGNKFRARIGINKIIINIGQFDTSEEAHNAYLMYKRQLHDFCTI